jgi:TusA-related sulfurtransferase
MDKIAVFTDGSGKLCEFFNADRFQIYEKSGADWKVTNTVSFEKIVPSSPALTRKNTAALLPLIESCDTIAGGTLVGIPFSVFDIAGKHIFEILEANSETFDDIIEEIKSSNADACAREAIIRDAKPVETSTPGIYFLDLIALQTEFPQVTSKQAMMEFLKGTPLVELRLVCKHIPPWIENSGSYNVKTIKEENGKVEAVITKKC